MRGRKRQRKKNQYHRHYDWSKCRIVGLGEAIAEAVAEGIAKRHQAMGYPVPACCDLAEKRKDDYMSVAVGKTKDGCGTKYTRILRQPKEEWTDDEYLTWENVQHPWWTRTKR